MARHTFNLHQRLNIMDSEPTNGKLFCVNQQHASIHQPTQHIQMYTKEHLVKHIYSAETNGATWRIIEITVAISLKMHYGSEKFQQERDLDCHQNVIYWSLCHVPFLQKHLSKFVHNFWRYFTRRHADHDDYINSSVEVINK